MDKEGKAYLKDYDTYTKKYDTYEKQVAQSILFVPLILKDKVLGVISVQSYEKNMYTRKDLNTLQILGSYIAIALENTQLFKEVEYRATYDVLTQSLNRREIVKQGLEWYQQDKEQLFIIMADVDYFKDINDIYGHVMGD